MPVRAPQTGTSSASGTPRTPAAQPEPALLGDASGAVEQEIVLLREQFANLSSAAQLDHEATADPDPKATKVGENGEKVASQAFEQDVSRGVEAMEAQWATLALRLENFRDTQIGILVSPDEDKFLALLEHQHVSVQGMDIQPDSWEQKLRDVKELFDELRTLQGNWMYLHDIRDSVEKAAQLRVLVDFQWFQAVESAFEQAVAWLQERPRFAQIAEGCAHAPEIKLSMLRQANEGAESICRAVSDGLEAVRTSFPRFYFLSNEELFQILSATGPQAKLPHLRKCFEALHELTLDGTTATAMGSSDGSVIDLVEPLVCTGPPEEWLPRLEESMRQSLQHELKEAMQSHEEIPFREWVLQHCGEMVLLGFQIAHTAAIDACLNDKPSATLRLRERKQDVSRLIRDLGLLARTCTENAVVSSLIALLIHRKDQLGQLIEGNVTSVHRFEWQKQMQYRVDSDQKATVQMLDFRTRYGYEFLGNSVRLVITPCTDRAYLVCTLAMGLGAGAAYSGPGGSGKTETCKDLARALGIQAVVLNCSDVLDYSANAKFLKGAASCGSWAMFDKLKRVNLEVLAVLSQQIATVFDAMRRRETPNSDDSFDFDGTQIRMRPSCWIAFTFNLSLKGGTRLPEGLLAQMRPVAMVRPDVSLIYKVNLLRSGFLEADRLAPRLVKCVDICESDLSSQPNYVWGMRFAKDIMKTNKQMRMQSPGSTELEIVRTAVYNVVSPRLIVTDREDFLRILNSVFPEVVHLGKTLFLKSSEVDDGSLGDADPEVVTKVKERAVAKGLQPTENFVQAVLQLKSIVEQRHGVAIIGPPGSGKTAVRETLQEMLKVSSTTLHPKALTRAQLYGPFEHGQSKESRKDGILTHEFRKMAQGNRAQWLVLDGAMDAIWLDNNVLDVSRMLLLGNDDRIALGSNCRIMFEVDHMRMCSPATTSRLGVLAVGADAVGWEPVVASWLDQLSDEAERQQLRALSGKYVPLCLDEIKKKRMRHQAPTAQLNALHTLFHIIDALRDDEKHKSESIAAKFGWAMVWAFAGNLHADSRIAFSEWWRDVFVDVPFPEPCSVFCCQVENDGLVPWNPGPAQTNELVDIPEQAMLQELFRLLVENGQHSFLLVGENDATKSTWLRTQVQRLPFRCFDICTDGAHISTTTAQTPAGGKAGLVVFVDELNAHDHIDGYGTSITVELLRAFVADRRVYDLSVPTARRTEQQCSIVATDTPPARAAPLDDRFQRHCAIFSWWPAADRAESLLSRTASEVVAQATGAEAGTAIEVDADSFLSLTVDNLTRLDPRYVFSHSDLQAAVSTDIATATATTFQGVASQMFATDRLVLASQVWLKLQAEADSEAATFLIRGPCSISHTKNPCGLWLSDPQWHACGALSKLGRFANLCDDLQSEDKLWKQWLGSKCADKASLPPKYGNLSDLDHLLLLRCLRPDTLVPTLAALTEQSPQQSGVTKGWARPTDIKQAIEDTLQSERFVAMLMLVEGQDTDDALVNIVEGVADGQEKKLSIVPQGQGRAQKTKKAIEDASKEGSWVFLRDCHHCLSFVPSLLTLLEDMSKRSSLARDFLLLMSIGPCELPGPLLLMSVRIPVEAQQDIEDLSSPESHGQDDISNISRRLCQAHAVIEERRKYGPLCWLERPACRQADLTHALGICRQLWRANKLTWPAVEHLVGSIIYGEHCHNDRDKAQVQAVIEFFLKDSLSSHQAEATPLDEQALCGTNCLLEPQTDMVLQSALCTRLFDKLATVMPACPDGAGLAPVDMAMLRQQLNRLEPPDLTVTDQLPSVFQSEMEGLRELLGAVQAAVNKDDQVDSSLWADVAADRVPSRWVELSHAWTQPFKLGHAWSSCQSLHMWLATLSRHVRQMRTWSQQPVKVFWLPGFLSPQKFLNAVLEAEAHREGVAVTDMQLGLEVTTFEFAEDVHAPASVGAYVNGFSLRNAAWNRKLGCLQPLNDDTRARAFPILQVRARASHTTSDGNAFDCPVTTKSRHDLMMKKRPSHWSGRQYRTAPWIGEVELGRCLVAINATMSVRDCVLWGVHLACDGAAEFTTNFPASDLHATCASCERAHELEIACLAAKPSEWLQANDEESTPLHALCTNAALTVDMLCIAVDSIGDGVSSGDHPFGKPDAARKTPLHLLCQSPRLSAALLNVVLQGPTQLWMEEKKDKKGQTPLHLLCARVGLEANSLRLVCDCLGHKAFLVPDEARDTPLHLLCKSQAVTASLLDVAWKGLKASGDDMDDCCVWNVNNSHGFTALETLCENEDAGIETMTVGCRIGCENGQVKCLLRRLIDRLGKHLDCSILDVVIEPLGGNKAKDIFLRADGSGQSLMSRLFEYDVYDSPASIQWCMNASLWSDERGENPLQCAIDTRKGSWVDALVDGLIEHRVVHHVNGILANIASLLEPNNYGQAAVRLLQFGGLYSVPTNNMPVEKLPVCDTGDLRTAFGQAETLSDVDRFAGYMPSEQVKEGNEVMLDKRRGKILKCRDRLYADVRWNDDLSTATYVRSDRLQVLKVLDRWDALRRAACGGLPTADETPTVEVVPSLVAIKNATKAGRGLLDRLVESENTDVFGSAVVVQIIEYKWRTFGVRMFWFKTAMHLIMVAAWSFVTSRYARSDEPLLASDVGGATSAGATLLCVATGFISSLHPIRRTAQMRTCTYRGISRCWIAVLYVVTALVTCASAVHLLGATENAVALAVLIVFACRSICDEWTDLVGGLARSNTEPGANPAKQAPAAYRICGQPYHPVPADDSSVADNETTDSGGSAEPQDPGSFIEAFVDYLWDFWNCIDFFSLALISVTVFRMLTGGARGTTTSIASFATSLLWLRMINYLAGFEKTAAYVQMTLAVSADMTTFLVMLLILVAGNVFTMQMLYPQSLQADLQLSVEDATTINNTFAGWGHAVFGSVQMLFASEFDTDLLDKAHSPAAAYANYLYFVVVVPLIMLNLLIALMGGSYERVEGQARNEGRKQRAKLLVDFELLLSPTELDDETMFPSWLFCFLPADYDDADDADENGVINGVGRQLDGLAQKLGKELDKQSVQQRSAVADLETKIKSVQQQVAQVDEKVAEHGAQLVAQMEALQGALVALARPLGPEPEPKSKPEPEPEPVK